MSGPSFDPGPRPAPPPYDGPAGEPRPASMAASIGRKAVVGAVGIGAIAAVAVGIWFAYDQGVKRGAGGAPTLIKAESGPYKTPPESPGGMQVPNQDKEVFDRLANAGKGAAAAGKAAESLLPPPEQPIAQPNPPPVASLPVPAALPNTAPVGAPAVTPAPVGAVAAQPAPPPGTQSTAAPPAAPPAAAATVPPVATLPAVQPPAAAAPAASPPPAPAKAAAPPSGGSGVRLQLGSVRTEADADKEWRRLKGRYASALSGAGVRYLRVDLGEKGIWYRIQAGPYADRAGAEAACAQLKSAGQGCSLVQ